MFPVFCKIIKCHSYRFLFWINHLIRTLIWKQPAGNSSNLGDEILKSRGMPTADSWYWLGIGILIIFAVLFNMVVTWALTFLNRKLTIIRVIIH